MTSKTYRAYHPATLFLILTMAVILLSWILNVYGIEAIIPQTGEVIRVQNLLEPESIRWFLRNAISNFTQASPLGMIMIAMLGIGIAQHSGYLSCFIRLGLHGRTPRNRVLLWIILLGILSNVVGNVGYIILLPLAALVFQAVGMHPAAGVLIAYISVGCGFSANLAIGTLDPLVARISLEATNWANITHTGIGVLSNYYFMATSTILLTAIIFILSKRYLLPAIPATTDTMEPFKPVSHKERRAFILATIAGIAYWILILWSTFSSYGILRGVSGNLVRSPFVMGILFLVALGASISGLIYGFYSGKFHTDRDVIKAFSESIKQHSDFFIALFFASQLVASLTYSNLDRCLLIHFSAFVTQLEVDGLTGIVLFIFFVACMNLLVVSATKKWSLLAFIFIPLFAEKGIAPEITQCAFRIGDSITNSITPFIYFFPLVVSYMSYYNHPIGYRHLVIYTLPYTISIGICWSILLVIFLIMSIPLGL